MTDLTAPCRIACYISGLNYLTEHGFICKLLSMLWCFAAGLIHFLIILNLIVDLSSEPVRLNSKSLCVILKAM